MNKEVIFDNNKAIVSNENGEMRVTPQYDNMKDILTEENVVEAIDNKINNIDKEIASIEKDINYRFTGMFFGCVVGVASLIILVASILKIGFGIEFINEAVTFLGGNRLFYIEFSLLIGGSLGTLSMAIMDKMGNDTRREEIKGLNHAKYYLCQEKGKELVKLERLNNTKKEVETNDPTISQVKIENPERLEDIIKYANAQCKVIPLFQYYHHLYKKAKLRKKLIKEGNSDMYSDYLRVIEEEGPRLIKKFKKTAQF